MTQEFLAHIAQEEGSRREQTLEAHCRGTADCAAEALAAAGLSAAGRLAGLVHDAGKAWPGYQDYLRRAAAGERVVRGSVNHTFAATRLLLTRYRDPARWGPYAPLTADLLSYAAGAHHGLFDCVDEQHRSGFLHRIEKEGTGSEEAIAGYLRSCVGPEELDGLFTQAVGETEAFLTDLLKKIGAAHPPKDDDTAFYLGLLARLLLSAVIEGDRRDTGQFMEGAPYPPPPGGADRQALWRRLSQRVDSRLDALPRDTAIRQARRQISELCRACGERPGGVYRLHVSTGGGKTLSALRFALAHAARWNKSRVIFTSPLLSILEQNCAVLRDYIGCGELILEHHSNVVREERSDKDGLDPAELLTETWDAPIIVTTLVQLLNTLFDGSGGAIRRFHALCGSVIILDEVQTVPGSLLSMFHLAVGFLAGACGATVVLCSATQPCSEAAEHPIPLPAEDMIPYDPALWACFRRTRLRDRGSLPLEGIPALAGEALDQGDSLLIVCNRKDQAERLYRAMPEEYRTFHLSAAMCMAHRRTVLAELQSALRSPGGRKIVCVSTQVIEAGVDISFAGVIRLAVGMDSVVQSAGRCNRNREREDLAPVEIVQCAGEHLENLPEIARGKRATGQLLREFHLHPEVFGGDLASDQAIRYYYTQLYRRETPGAFQNGPVHWGGRSLSLLDLLSQNRAFADPSFGDSFEAFALHQAFRTAGACFSVFQTDSMDVLVPYGRGRQLIGQLGALELPRDLRGLRRLLKEARPYTVALYPWQRRSLEAAGALVPLCGGAIFALQEGFYDEACGLRTERRTLEFQEV